MSRMCDRMLAGTVKPFLKHDRSTSSKEIVRLFDDCEILSIDNVAHYLYAETPQEHWDVMNDFPNIAPPFEKFWMEYNYPYEILTPKGLQRRERGVLRSIGFKFEGRAIYEPNMGDIRENTAHLLRAFIDLPHVRKVIDGIILRMKQNGQTNITSDSVFSACDASEQTVICIIEAIGWLTHDTPAPHVALDRLESGVKWAMYADLYMDVGTYIVGPIIHWTVFLTPHGLPMLNPLIATFGPPDAVSPEIGNEIWSALLALSFLHCKNVSLSNVTPPERLSRAHQKRRGRPLMNFKTLEIKPMTRVLRHEGQSGQTGLKKALHICRGHFKDYSKHGLFGKYKGLYWWDSHVRGQASEGRIVKDYAVHPPKAEGVTL